ncbi:protein phosphatase 1G-like, partial [Saccostrea cucullata]|uniref:protein phosphatase 1G-like n=1 Tax=Saccostrea cuccullata TaxID=36930 RepID=UPI002ED3E158
MGAYLSTPNTEKISIDKVSKRFCYGASSMQGWRVSQEDSHNCIDDLDEDTALFAVYDGHGGSEVAQYASLHFPDYIKQHPLFKEGKLKEALENAFLEFDQKLLEKEACDEMRVLAGIDEERDEEAKRKMKIEADILRTEADMPLEDLLAKYEGCPQPRLLKRNRGSGKVNSPMLKGKKESKFTAMCAVEIEEAAGGSAESETSWTRDKLANGHAENENNLNREKEQNESNQMLNDQNECESEDLKSDVKCPMDSAVGSSSSSSQPCVSSSSDGPSKSEESAGSISDSGDVKQESSVVDNVSSS